MDSRGAVIPDPLSEQGGGHIEGDSHPQVKREFGEMELQMQRGRSCHEH